MPSFNLDLSIKESDDIIQKRMAGALKEQVGVYFKKAFDRVKGEIVSLVQSSIINSPEYESLSSGKLMAEFGLPDSDQRLLEILKFWEKLEIDYSSVKVKNNSLNGSFSLNMIRSDYSDVLATTAAVFTTEKGTSLKWLEWLLLFGDKKIIKDYNVVLGPSKRSRTGMAVMRGVISGKWGVPSEFSGTANNNWITRAIDSIDSKVEELLIASLER